MKQRTIIATIATAIVAGISHAEWSAPLVRVSGVRGDTVYTNGVSKTYVDAATNATLTAAKAYTDAHSGTDTNAVHYAADAGKTDAQKAAARTNIVAASGIDFAALRLTVLGGETFRASGLESGHFYYQGEKRDNANYSCTSFNVRWLDGCSIYIRSRGLNASTYCHWGKLDGTFETIVDANPDGYYTVPSGATVLYFSAKSNQISSGDVTVAMGESFFSGNAVTNGGAVAYCTDLIERYNGETTEIKNVFTKPDCEAGYWFDASGTKSAVSGWACREFVLKDFRGKTVYINSVNLAYDNRRHCKWKLDDGTVSIIQPESTETIGFFAIPTNAVSLLYNMCMSRYDDTTKLVIVPTGKESAIGSFNSLRTRFLGKRFTSYGDSTVAQNTWQPKLAGMLGTDTCVVQGTGGAMAGGDSASSLYKDAMIATIPTNSELVVIVCGANDYGQSEPLGDLDYENETTNTYYGAMNLIARKVMARAPGATIYFSMFYAQRRGPQNGFSADGRRNALGLTCYDYRDAQREFCRQNGFGYLDVMGDSGINSHNVLDFYRDESGLFHPDDRGGNRIAETMFRQMVSE